MEQFLKIKQILDSKLTISYKRLSIGAVQYDDKVYIQVDCDRYDIQTTKLYQLKNTDFAIAAFTGLLSRYMASELKNGA